MTNDMTTARLLTELSAPVDDGAACCLLAECPSCVDAAPCAWLCSELPFGVEHASSSLVPAHAAASASAAAVLPPLPLQLPSLADLSMDHLSLNSAYLAPGSMPFQFLPFHHTFYPTQQQRPVRPTLNPLATMTACGTWYVRWADCIAPRGHNNKTALTFHWRSQPIVDGAIAAATVAAASVTSRLVVKLYSHKGLLNRNAHYRRGRFGCVLLTAHHAIAVTAFRASAHSEVVMLREQRSSLEPLLALARGMCYEIRFFSSATNAADVTHIAALSDGDLVASRSPVQPSTASPASTATALPSATVTTSPSISTSTFPGSSSAPATPISTIQFNSNLPSRTRVSCASCRKAKAKCDEQR